VTKPILLQSLPGIEGIHVEFVASGESDPTDSPSDLAIKVGLQAQQLRCRLLWTAFMACCEPPMASQPLRLPAPHLSTTCVVSLPVVLAVSVAMQNVNSEKSVTVDGEKLENGKEKKLGIGMKILFGDDTEYQVQHMAHTVYAHKQTAVLSDCKHI